MTLHNPVPMVVDACAAHGAVWERITFAIVSIPALTGSSNVVYASMIICKSASAGRVLMVQLADRRRAVQGKSVGTPAHMVPSASKPAAAPREYKAL